MRRITLLSISLTLPVLAAAQAPTPAFTGNFALVSEYRFRGIDQTFGNPAVQGGVDYTHPSGVYLGNWNSNVSSGAGYPGGNLEMDFYGGYRGTSGDFGFDAGLIYYDYPGTDAGSQSTPLVQNNRTLAIHSGPIDNTEFYVGGSWKFLSLKYFHALGDYFSIPDTANTSYLDAAVSFTLGNGWGVNAHYGHLDLKGFNNGSYSDWKLGLKKEFARWIFGAEYVGTNAKGDCTLNEPYCYSKGNGAPADQRRDAGRSTVVFSAGRSF